MCFQPVQLQGPLAQKGHALGLMAQMFYFEVLHNF